MNTEALFLFLILLLGLVLCSFLGGNCGSEGFTGNFSGTFTTNNNNRQSSNKASTNGASTASNIKYDNYNHYEGSSTQLTSGNTFYGKNGGSVVVNTNSDGTQSLQVTLADGQQPMTFSPQSASSSQSSSSTESYTNYYGNNGSATTYYGPNGSTATIVYADNGQQAVNVQTSTGSYTFTSSGSYYNPDNTSSTQYYGSTGYQVNTYQGAYGGSAGAVTGPQGNSAYYAEGPNGATVAGTTDTNPYYYQGASSSQYYGPYGGSAGAVTGPQGNSAYYAQGPNGTTVAGTSSNYDYSNSLPPGIPASQIPAGQEDLYILKSQVVPPVCPAPTVIMSDPNKEAKCPPCIPCGRVPEPSFECKKVPNYNAIDNQYLPQPVLNDFSTFGM